MDEGGLGTVGHSTARRAGLLPWVLLGVGAALTLALIPVDGPLLGWARSLPLGGDVRRELVVLGQFGGPVSLVLAGLVVWRLDPARRVRLWDLAAGAGAAWLAVQALKLLVGRPRPKFDDPMVFLGPFGAYPMGTGEGVRHAWEVWGQIGSELWSMPSSHSSAAAALAAFLAVVYPRLGVVVVPMAVGVGVTRVLFGAHWPSDVAAGLAIGGALGWWAARGCWGSRWWAGR